MPKRVGSGQKTSDVTKLLNNLVSSLKIHKVECTFCSKRLLKNGTRLLKHIQDCKKYPDSVKEKYTKTTRQVPYSTKIVFCSRVFVF